jgi:hypothetical protein
MAASLPSGVFQLGYIHERADCSGSGGEL